MARTCYDHIAGHLGVALMTSLLDQGAVTGGDGRHPRQASADRLSGPGRDVRYALTRTGRSLFADLGVVLPAGRRQEVGYCVDWTEQRHHLAGAAGAGLCARLEGLAWIRHGWKGVPRALEVTDRGRRGLADCFGIEADPRPTSTRLRPLPEPRSRRLRRSGA
jgi:hypothetical protein